MRWARSKRTKVGWYWWTYSMAVGVLVVLEVLIIGLLVVLSRSEDDPSNG